MSLAWYKFLKSVFGTKTADKLTKYQYWTIPMAENIDPPRIRDRVSPDGPINWETGAEDFIIDHRSTVMKDGVLTGIPAQWGTTQMRSLTWGYAIWGQIGALRPEYKTRIPRPASGWYWVTGHPVPSFDEGCIVREPHATQTIIHELIQFDPFAQENIATNQALGWGKWVDGVLVEGRSVSATRDSVSKYLWTPWSSQNPHRLSMVVWNYIGADGDLVDEGVEAGRVVMLDPNSESYKNMVALGGECEAIAKAAAEFGVLVADIKGPSPEGNPRAASFRIQPGAQWLSTNIDKLELRHGDFVYAK
jgi:hypothetical protein